ncbi:MAG: 23S rRNA (adenine(2503)-C(2))-methyltransferase RlmN [Clostridiales Family XIII bacterium]|jgi:23S rRNA (adenine2503-C2)-methyltransferase|nr:23S rRNA (adenine(2503)-C(2))-methyltransferase RlmN [Clostridiales Family XIII bacterium]
MDIKILKTRVRKTLSKKRFLHTINVMETAVKLAEKFNFSDKKIVAVKIASLYHDIAKEEKGIHSLMHAKIAAKMAEKELKIDTAYRDKIINAISYHTTGRVNMSDIEKIVFIADKIEPGREYVGVDEIKESLNDSLDSAVLEFLKQSINYLNMKDIKIAKESIDAFEFYNDNDNSENLKLNLKNYNKEKLYKIIQKDFQEKKYRADQIYEWLYKGISSYNKMLNIPKELIKKLNKKTILYSLKIKKNQKSSKDGTIKILFETIDNEFIESVLMFYDYGISLCISSQIGCRFGCKFCASSKNGFIRNLSPAEIIDQVLIINNEILSVNKNKLYNGINIKFHHKTDLKEQIKISHIVFMGMGEPLDNYENLMIAISNFSNPKGYALGRKHITVSTCGLLEKMERFLQDLPLANLAISLHHYNDEKRNKIMPINKKYNIKKLILFAKKYTKETNRRISFEYALIPDFNDSKKDAMNLAKLIKNINCHINLIKLNTIDEGEKYTEEELEKRAIEFKVELEKHKLITPIRRRLGDDIAAACGQLRRRYKDIV